MANFFRLGRKPTPIDFKHKSTLEITITMGGHSALDTVRLTGQYDNPNAFVAALYKLAADPVMLSQLAEACGADLPFTCHHDHDHDDDGLGRGYL